MEIITIHFLIGALLYPASVAAWYRIHFDRDEFHLPEHMDWYLEFFIFVLLWPIAGPLAAWDLRMHLRQQRHRQ
jgi:hypothetical protein